MNLVSWHRVRHLRSTYQNLPEGYVGSDGLYEFPLIDVSNFAKSSSMYSLLSINNMVPSGDYACETSSLPNVWHLRLGHHNIQSLRLIMHSYNIIFNNKYSNLFFFAWCMGKAHILHSSTSNTTYAKPLELIYTDLWGASFSASASGFLYYMPFVDAYYKFTWIYLLKYKFEALTIFK